MLIDKYKKDLKINELREATQSLETNELKNETNLIENEIELDTISRTNRSKSQRRKLSNDEIDPLEEFMNQMRAENKDIQSQIINENFKVILLSNAINESQLQHDLMRQSENNNEKSKSELNS